MNNSRILIVALGLLAIQCNKPLKEWSDQEKEAVQIEIQLELNNLLESVSNKDIEAYMKKMPNDFIIYDVSGTVITREQQRANTLRDWSIIDSTLHNEMHIDSIQFISKDSIYVFTDQLWERLMFRRDGDTLDTVITTQRHKELWKNTPEGWTGYDVEELGGEIFINGERYFE